MSLKSWKREFYRPINRATSSWLKACEHSLRKWEGATKPNLRAHGLVWDGDSIAEKPTRGQFYWDIDSLEFDDDTCALCRRADEIIDKQFNGQGYRCSVCPLVAIQGGVDCTQGGSPFDYYYQTGRPAKMIRALRKLHKQLSKVEK